jgi:S1-C subfamily serine protease
VGVAPEKDLAVLRINFIGEELIPLPLGSSENLKVGQNVFAIGNPFGLDHTLTKGIISALGREINSQSSIPIRDVIQTDAAINPGNSGGPLLDSSGKLIGVNTAIYSPSGAYAGIGFSIPVDVVKYVIPDLIQFGALKRPVLGVELLTNPQLVERFKIVGALVVNVTKGGGAEAAGIIGTKRNRNGDISWGDIIIGVNEEKIESNSDLVYALEKYEEGDIVRVKLMRNDNLVETEIKLGSK